MRSRDRHAAISAMAFLLPALLALAACSGGGESMNQTDLTDFATRYAAAWSSQDPEQLAAFYTEEGVLNVNDGDPAVGREAITATARAYMEAFPDMVVKLGRLEVKSEDRADFHWIWTGTNTGPGGTGAAVSLKGYEEWTLENGLIRQSLGHYDAAEYERQLGAGH